MPELRDLICDTRPSRDKSVCLSSELVYMLLKITKITNTLVNQPAHITIIPPPHLSSLLLSPPSILPRLPTDFFSHLSHSSQIEIISNSHTVIIMTSNTTPFRELLRKFRQEEASSSSFMSGFSMFLHSHFSNCLR